MRSGFIPDALTCATLSTSPNRPTSHGTALPAACLTFSGGSRSRTHLHRLGHLRCIPRLRPRATLLLVYDLGDGIKSRVRLSAGDSILYSVVMTPTDSAQPHDDLRTLEPWERRWLMPFNEEKCHQLTVTKEKEHNSLQLQPPQQDP